MSRHLRWSASRAAANTRRRIEAVRKLAEEALTKAAADWEDEDEFLRGGAEAARGAIQDALDSYLKELNDAMQDKAEGDQP